MPRIVGSGAALFDFDNDEHLDILLIQNGGPKSGLTHQLFRQETGRFVNVSKGSGLDIDGYGMGVACGDINNDGRDDVLVTEYGRARLFVNETTDATPRFVDVSESAGIINPMWGTSTCFVDFDRNGWLDIVIVNYVNYDPSRWCADEGGQQEFCGPNSFSGRTTKLFKNLGLDESGKVRFEDVTISSGLSARPGPGLGVFCADFDGDQWPDVFIANDGKANHLWMNQRDGTFREEAITRGVGYNSMGKTEADMGIAIGDVDGNGHFDVFVTHLTTETHTLWSQGPRGLFTDRTATTGLTSVAWRGTGFGTAMADVDNDNDLDLIVANGRVRRGRGPKLKTRSDLAEFWSPYAERDQLFLNDGTGTFEDASEDNLGLSFPATVSRGMACGDIDNDGDLDVLITRVGGPPLLLRNTNTSSGHWLNIKAIDPELNRDAYGAEVTVVIGEKRTMRWVNPGYSYLCSNDPRAHFGLGSAESVDSIEVIWPDGLVEEFPGGDVDRQIVLRRGKGSTITSSTP